MDHAQLDIIGPLAPIVGAVSAAAVSALVTYFVVMKRKKVEFWIAASEKIAPPHNRHQNILFKIGDKDVLNLNKGEVSVKNSGNKSIANFIFHLKLPGVHSACFAEIAASDGKLRDDVKLEQAINTENVFVKVSLDFFNQGEAFQILTYFDGVTTDWLLNFRMEEVRCKMQRGDF